MKEGSFQEGKNPIRVVPLYKSPIKCNINRTKEEPKYATKNPRCQIKIDDLHLKLHKMHISNVFSPGKNVFIEHFKIY